MPATSQFQVGDYVHSHPQRLGGVPVFKGSRVPIKSLFDHLRAGDTIDRFLDDFPGITREQVDAVLQMAQDGLLKEHDIHAHPV